MMHSLSQQIGRSSPILLWKAFGYQNEQYCMNNIDELISKIIFWNMTIKTHTKNNEINAITLIK